MLSEIVFYNITNPDFEKSVCRIIAEIYHNDRPLFVKVPDTSHQNSINDVLWTYAQHAFIPHGSIADPYPEKQPVLISHLYENKNMSEILILVANEAKLDFCQHFKKVVMLFSDFDDKQKSIARIQYKNLSNIYSNIVYNKFV